MGLFDFLSPKPKALSADSVETAEDKRLKLEMELEYVRKQVANLYAVGRKVDAQNAITTFLEGLNQRSIGGRATQSDLTKLSYGLAYFFLPELVYKDWDNFLQLWNDSFPFPTFLALKGALVHKVHLTTNQFGAFKAQAGRFDEATDLYLVEYPTPIECNVDAKRLHSLAPEKMPVLGPYFTAILHTRNTGDRRVYNLGQSFGPFKTVRTVTADGTNGNCGPCFESSAQAFLERLHGIVV